ncbi:hypothetical protein [Embleya sp. AB8]|uniref:hypothetical protein n=1 Tax=Embleya sp. AB8 TaxID=3156304 RepID=UPI003C74002A
MGGFLGFATVAGSLAVLLAGFRWLAMHVRRRGTAGAAIRAAMASYDEALHGTANDAHLEIREQARRKVPMQSPDDPWRPQGLEVGLEVAYAGALGRTPKRRFGRCPPRRRLWQRI